MSKEIIPRELIEQKIYLVRGQKVMLDRDLAALYGVKTRVLNQAVKRNLKRFPKDFMFQLTSKELKNWMSQIVTSNREKMGVRKNPHVFTEQGVAMLSSVLSSDRAVIVNIHIMRTFVRLRKFLTAHRELAYRLKQLEMRIEKHDEEIRAIFEAIQQLIEPPVEEKPKRQIGFHHS